MKISDVTVNGSGFDKEYNFKNYALTLVFRNNETEKTVRANLRYYPSENEWDLNPIFHEYTEDESFNIIQVGGTVTKIAVKNVRVEPRIKAGTQWIPVILNDFVASML